MKVSTRRPKLFRASPASMAVIALLLLPIAAHALAGPKRSTIATSNTGRRRRRTSTICRAGLSSTSAAIASLSSAIRRTRSIS